MRSPKLPLFLALILSLIAREAYAQVGPPTALPQGIYTTTSSNGGNVINDAGQIVGSGVAGGPPVPILWPSPATPPIPLPVAGFTGAQFAARGINNAGQIIGEFGSGFSQIPIYWASPAATPIPLSMGIFGPSSAIGINNLGQIVGSPTGDFVALFWSSPLAAPTALPPGPFVPPMCASGINDAGQIVGYGSLGGGPIVPVFWASPISAPVPLPMGALTAPFLASGINNAGQIVGASGAGGIGYLTPVFWSSPAGTPSALPAGIFTPSIAAMGINSSGQIAGFGNSAGTQVAILWSSSFSVTALKAAVTALVTGGTLTASQGSVLNQILDQAALRYANGQGGGAASLLRSFNTYVQRYPIPAPTKALLLAQSNALITLALALPPGGGN